MKEKIESGKETRFIGKMKAETLIYHQKGRAIAMSIILLFTGFVSMIVLAPPASAQSQIPSYYGWAGYNGNFSVYMSTSSSLAANPYVLPSETKYVDQPANTQQGTGVNGIALSTTSISTPAGTTPLHEQYDPAEGQLVVTIPTVAASGTNQTRFDDFNNGGYNVYGIARQNLSVSISGLTDDTLNPLYTDSGAVNLTLPNGVIGGTSTTGYTVINKSLVMALGLVPYLGYFVSDAQLAADLADYGQTPSKIVLGGSGYALSSQNLTVNPSTGNYSKWSNGTGPSEGLDYQYGQNVLASEIINQVNINASNFVRSGYVNVHGANYLGQYDSISWTLDASPNGASVSINLSFVPAYTITGTAYINGVPASNQELLLQSASANYYIYTNANGQYRFFAQPGTEYFLTGPSVSIGGVQIYPLSANTGGGNYNLYLTSATFSESGLSGQTWSVELSGPITPSGNQEYYTQFTSGSSITISLTGNESYGYTIGTPPGYTATPSSGYINVGYPSYNAAITFTKTPTYTVTFKESGLPSGTVWAVKFNGNQKSTTSSSISFYSVSDGSYSFSIPDVYYSSTYTYYPSPSSGTITVNGGDSSQSIQFYGEATSCVYANAPVLLSNFTFQYADSITVGESIMTYNFTTGTMQQGAVLQVFVTQHPDMYDINGYIKIARDQDIWTSHGYVQAQNLTSNDLIFDVFNHQFFRIHSISVEYGNFTMYDFDIGVNHNYIAWSNLMQDRIV